MPVRVWLRAPEAPKRGAASTTVDWTQCEAGPMEEIRAGEVVHCRKIIATGTAPRRRVHDVDRQRIAQDALSVT